MPPADRFGFTIKLDDGFVVYDCGYIARIEDMWDEDGDWTRNWREAERITWRPPGDYPASFKCVMDVSHDDDDDFETDVMLN